MTIHWSFLSSSSTILWALNFNELYHCNNFSAQQKISHGFSSTNWYASFCALQAREFPLSALVTATISSLRVWINNPSPSHITASSAPRIKRLTSSYHPSRQFTFSRCAPSLHRLLSSLDLASSFSYPSFCPSSTCSPSICRLTRPSRCSYSLFPARTPRVSVSAGTLLLQYCG